MNKRARWRARGGGRGNFQEATATAFFRRHFHRLSPPPHHHSSLSSPPFIHHTAISPPPISLSGWVWLTVVTHSLSLARIHLSIESSKMFFFQQPPAVFSKPFRAHSMAFCQRPELNASGKSTPSRSLVRSR